MRACSSLTSALTPATPNTWRSALHPLTPISSTPSATQRARTSDKYETQAEYGKSVRDSCYVSECNPIMPLGTTCCLAHHTEGTYLGDCPGYKRWQVARTCWELAGLVLIAYKYSNIQQHAAMDSNILVVTHSMHLREQLT